MYFLLKNHAQHHIHKHDSGFGTYKVGFIPASASSAAPSDSGPQRTAEECVSDALAVGYRFLEWYVHHHVIMQLYIWMTIIFYTSWNHSWLISINFWTLSSYILVLSFMGMRQRLERQLNRVVSRGKNCSYAARCGRQLSKRGRMQSVLDWTRVSCIKEAACTQLLFIAWSSPCAFLILFYTYMILYSTCRSEHGLCWLISYSLACTWQTRWGVQNIGEITKGGKDS